MFMDAQTLRSAEHAAIFWPVGSNLQLRISACKTYQSKNLLKVFNIRTLCAPERLMMGASRLLVLWMDRIKPLLRSSFPEEMTT